MKNQIINNKIINTFFKIKILKILIILMLILFCLKNNYKVYGNPNSLLLKTARYHNHDFSRTEVKYKYQKLLNNQIVLKEKEYYLLDQNEPYKICQYEYDNLQGKKSKIISKIVTIRNNFFVFKFEKSHKQNISYYLYNDQDQLIKIKDDNNRIIEKYNYDEQGRVKSKKKFYYILNNIHNQDSLINFLLNKYNYKYFTETYYFEYNEKGQLIKKILYDIHYKNNFSFPFTKLYNFIFLRKVINKTISENEYDSMGYKIKKIKTDKKNIQNHQKNKLSTISNVYTYCYSKIENL